MFILGRSPYAESGILFRGWGGPGPTAGKQSGQRVFFCFLFFIFFWGGGGYSPELILQLTEGPMVLLQRKLYFSKDPEGVQNFPG